MIQNQVMSTCHGYTLKFKYIGTRAIYILAIETYVPGLFQLSIAQVCSNHNTNACQYHCNH